jgi:hypothetical protein
VHVNVHPLYDLFAAARDSGEIDVGHACRDGGEDGACRRRDSKVP